MARKFDGKVYRKSKNCSLSKIRNIHPKLPEILKVKSYSIGIFGNKFERSTASHEVVSFFRTLGNILHSVTIGLKNDIHSPIEILNIQARILGGWKAPI